MFRGRERASTAALTNKLEYLGVDMCVTVQKTAAAVMCLGRLYLLLRHASICATLLALFFNDYLIEFA